MKAEGLSEACQNSFVDVMKQLQAGATGFMPEKDIQPAKDVQTYGQVEEAFAAATPSAEETAALYAAAVVIKLNGGLGTGMGLDKAKSLLQVKGEDTFLDFIVKQLEYSAEHGTKASFMLMNSFSTSDDTKAYLAKYPEYNTPDNEFVQNKVPKLSAEFPHFPQAWPENPQNEWCPPGHGDIFPALSGSGRLDALLAAGKKYAFISNSDNLGATLDVKILDFFAKSKSDFLMEVCERTEADKKGGHLCVTNGRFNLRESANCPSEDEKYFQDITVHKYFNTNNLWVNLESLKALLQETGGIVKLPLIRNAKTVDPKKADSPKVFQLETAMGSAIAAFKTSLPLVVPRTRFAPVKTCNDLVALRSDAYVVNADQTLSLAKAGGQPPVINLDGKLHKLVGGVEQLLSKGVPSLIDCERLDVTGAFVIAESVKIVGKVKLINNDKEPVVLENLVLTNEERSFP